MRFTLEKHWEKCVSKFMSDWTTSKSHLPGNQTPSCIIRRGFMTQLAFSYSTDMRTNVKFVVLRELGSCIQKPPIFLFGALQCPRDSTATDVRACRSLTSDMWQITVTCILWSGLQHHHPGSPNNKEFEVTAINSRNRVYILGHLEQHRTKISEWDKTITT